MFDHAARESFSIFWFEQSLIVDHIDDHTNRASNHLFLAPTKLFYGFFCLLPVNDNEIIIFYI